MRAKEFITEGQEHCNGIDISMEIQKDDEYVDDEDYDNQVLYVTASSKGKELGHVLFAFDGEYLMPQDLEVEERYRGQGIAQIMYDYVKSKGYKIRRSGQQTDAGAGFWDKHKPGKNVWEQGVAEGLNEGQAHPIIVVDVQPEYSGMNDGDENSVFTQIINFVNKQTGPVLMFVNAEDQGLSGDTIQDIKMYWEDSGFAPQKWQRVQVVDKGYGYLRSWMDHGIEPATIIATIRELYQQKKTDSRELQFPASSRRTPQQSLIMGAMQEMEDDPISVNWTSVAQLKRFSGAYIVGGARDQCLREVELLMNAFNIKYKRIDTLIYTEDQQGVAEGKINPAGLNHTQQIGDYVYRAKALNGSDEGEIKMTAYDGKKSIADTVFMPYGSGGRMISGQTYVHPAYRGKGVAAGMYAYLRMLGFKIEPSGIRTDAGKAMWDKWEKAGDAKYLSKGVAEGFDIGQEWMSDTELDQYVPERLQQQWRELLGYDRNGNPSALWANLTGGYEPDVNDPQHRRLMVKVANKWFAAKKIPNVKFFDVKDADDELEWLVQIGEQGVAEAATPSNKLFVKKLTSEQELIEHAKQFAKNLVQEGVPITSKNRYTVVCSTIFAQTRKSLTESKHIIGGKQVIELLKRLDQFPKLSVKVGSKVAIINSQLQGDSIELWGFTTPKTITKIYRDPSDKSIKQFEFNNDPDDVWPRTENAEYNGQFLMYSAFFDDKKSAEHALTMLTLQASGDLIIRNHITKQGVAEGLSEARNSLFAFVKQQFPTWPDYVLKDFLYQQAKGIRDQAELDDFLKRNKQDFGNCKWTLTKLPITFDIFTPKTQRMLASREGGSSNPFQVPRDAERHAQQSQMIQQKGVSAEPIIVAKLSNGYDLIEGWHRTIQHLKAFPQGYTGPAWVCTGATYKSESVEQGVAEGKVINTYLWHGSRQKIPMLEPRQSVDTGGAAGSNQNAIYATSDPKVAIAMGLTTAGSDTGMFPNDPQMVLFSGKIRKGEYVYLHKLPFKGPDGKPQFVQGGNSREFHSIPGVEGIKPIEIKEIPVNKYLNLIRKATPADLKLRKKYMKKQGVAEGVNPDVTSDEYFIEPTKNVRMGNFVFNARTFTGGLGNRNAKGLQIRAYDPKNLKNSIGSADFIVKKHEDGNTWLESDNTEVNQQYHGKGVATMMYAFAKSLGNDIKRSPYQSKAGSDMWNKWGKDAKNLVSKRGVAEGASNNIPTIGINVRTDGDIDYASLIVDGEKKYESRKTDSLRPYVGKIVGIVRTGSGPAVAIGQVTIGEPILVDAEKFNRLRKQHLIPQGSKFDIDSTGTKYLYPMIDPVRWNNEKPIKHKGIISRKIQEQGKV
jgi:GNAT superfamily N-acetyltransferase